MKSRKSTEIRKEEILRAALIVVGQRGLDKLNINDIAAQIDLVPSAIYRHFKGKEEIIAALIEFIDGCLRQNLATVAPLNETAPAKLKMLFELHVKLLREETAVPRVLYSLISSDRNPELQSRMLLTVGHYVQQVKKILLQGQKKGEISPDIDPAAAALLFLGMIQPLAILSRLEEEVLNDYPAKLWQNYHRSIAV
ncbi:MAG: TetR/AcrR family transcriptional regulator [Negativicutes bacterium]